MQAVFQAPLFGVRWRWDAARSLAVLRHTGGRKVPIPLLRMRSEDLLAAVFPAQVACQDNAPPGDIEPPDHPLGLRDHPRLPHGGNGRGGTQGSADKH